MKPQPPNRPAPNSESEDSSGGPTNLWPLGLSLLAALAAAGVFLLFQWKMDSKRGPAPSAQISAAQADLPLAKFTDITAESGIRFAHVNGAYGDKLLPETMGGGVAFLDFDNDGDQDLLFVNSSSWPWRSSPAGPATMGLYQNDGAGRFAEATAGSGLDVSLYGMGAAVGDYDNDGLADIFISALGGGKLFRNLGAGKFQDVTASAGIPAQAQDWGASSAWIDFDNDGDLDLFVCRYVQWSREIDFEVNYQLAGIGRAYGPPMNFPGSFPSLYRNEGGGKFKDVSAESGIQIKHPATGVPMAKSLGVAPVDINGDNWIDLVMANDTVQNFVFSNRHNGTFKEIGASAGIAFDSFGQTRGAMGIDAARFRNDDALGIAIGNFANEMNALYVSRRDSVVFADEAITEGVGAASQPLLKFGLFFFDYDLDGRLDVLTTNGHLDEGVEKALPGQRYRQPAQLFWNSGAIRGARFVPATPERAGADLFQPIVGRGSAYADIDNDGDLDVVMTQIGGPPLLLRNDQNLRRHWARFKLEGTRANRDAIGAWIQLRSGNRVYSRQVMPTKGYLSQSELPVTIGLGENAQIDEVTVTWPGGEKQKVAGIQADRLTIIKQAERK